MIGLLVFNVVLLVLIAMILGGRIPERVYAGVVRGLHFTIGISTPTPRQLRWTLAVWLISVLAIVDGIALLLLLKYI
jgi:hypothetical protein